MALYVVNYLDRVNVGFAALTMNADLKFSPAAYGFGAGLFFAGYLLSSSRGIVLARSARRAVRHLDGVGGYRSTALCRTPVGFDACGLHWARPKPASFPSSCCT
jgi:hypothetical protein